MMNDTAMENVADLARIQQKKVKEYVALNRLHQPAGFSALKTACYDPRINESYHIHQETFVVRKPVAQVWHAYKSINPKEAWNGAMVSFGLQFARSSNTLSYVNDRYTGMEVGQVIVLHLRLLLGLLNIAVAHEVVEVNEAEKLIKLCYMEGGASEGSQWINLRETADGFTEVFHKTLYKSNSPFRDKWLYPRLHTKAIGEFHENVKRKAESGG